MKHAMLEDYLKLRLKQESIPYSIFLKDLPGLSIQKQKQLPTRAVVSYKTNMRLSLQNTRKGDSRNLI